MQRHHDSNFNQTTHQVFNASLNRRTLLGSAAATSLIAGGFGRVSSIAAQDEAPVRGGSLTVAVVGPITSLDPFSSKLASGDAIAYQLLYNTLVSISPTGEIVPELATSWTISEDGLIYAFTLQSGVTFNDGSPLDAESVVFNIDRYRAEGTTFSNANKLVSIGTVAATDTATVTVTLSQANAPFLAAMSLLPIVSPTAVAAQGEDFQLTGVGSGPFTTVEWTPGATATFARRDTYWQAGDDGQPLPYLDEVVIEGVADDAVRLLNLRSGQFDVNERVEPKDRAALDADANLSVLDYTSVTSYLVALNVTASPFDNQVLRQAVSSALDRQAIIDNIGFGTGYTSPMPFPQEAWFFIPKPAPVFDTDAATAKLSEAGYPDGIDVKLSIINRPIDNQISQIVKALLDTVGIRTEIEVLERTTWVDLWNARGGQMGILQRGAGTTDPDDQSAFFDAANIANFAGYDSPPISDLVAQANQTVDQAERLAIWQQITQMVVDDAVYIFIGAVPTVGAIRASVKNVQLAGGGLIDVGAAWLAE